MKTRTITVPKSAGVVVRNMKSGLQIEIFTPENAEERDECRCMNIALHKPFPRMTYQERADLVAAYGKRLAAARISKEL